MRSETLPPLRDDYYEIENRHVHFVDIRDKAVRRILVELLETYGYRASSGTQRGECIRTFLPLIVDTDKKEINHTANITCAAAACTRKMVMDLEEFLIIYDRDIRPKEKTEE